MRTLLLTLLVAALALPAAALGAYHDKGDGFLAVKGGKGQFSVSGKGSVLGRVDLGALTVTDTNPFDGTDPAQVFGADKTVTQGPMTTVYSGKDIRFRIVGTRFRISVTGSGIALSAVGNGRVTMLADDGKYALDGAAFADVPTGLFNGTFGLATTIVGG